MQLSIILFLLPSELRQINIFNTSVLRDILPLKVSSLYLRLENIRPSKLAIPMFKRRFTINLLTTKLFIYPLHISKSICWQFLVWQHNSTKDRSHFWQNRER